MCYIITMININGIDYTEAEVQLAVNKSIKMRWTDSVFGSWADHQYPEFSVNRFIKQLETLKGVL